MRASNANSISIFFVFAALVLGILFPIYSGAAECPPFQRAAYKNFDDVSLEKAAVQSAEERDFCQEFGFSYERYRRAEELSLAGDWLKKAVRALKKQGDAAQTVKIILAALELWPELRTDASLRFDLLEAEAILANLPGTIGREWAEYYLGIQNGRWDFLQGALFARDFPQSGGRAEDYRQLNQRVKKIYLAAENEILQQYERKHQFMAILFRLEQMARFNFVMEDQSLLIEILARIARVENDFSDWIDSGRDPWPDSRLRQLPGIPKPYSRDGVAEYFRAKAQAVERTVVELKK